VISTPVDDEITAELDGERQSLAVTAEASDNDSNDTLMYIPPAPVNGQPKDDDVDNPVRVRRRVRQSHKWAWNIRSTQVESGEVYFDR
jgi:hypothetical protein